MVIINPFAALPRVLSHNTNSLDPDETPSNSASHPGPSCLTLSQYFRQTLNESVKFKDKADDILRMRRTASGSEGVYMLSDGF